VKIAYDAKYHAHYPKLGTYNPQHTITCRDKKAGLEIGKKILFLSVGVWKEAIEYF